MDFVKHECGIGMVRLLKGKEHYEQRYGDVYYGLHLLEKLMIRQYNRGQDGAGMGCIDISTEKPTVYQIRQEGASAIEHMAETIDKDIAFERDWGSSKMPYYGNLMLGHVRYSTTGRRGECYLHPLRHDHGGSDPETLLMCGNFHLINTDRICEFLKEKGIEADPGFDTDALLNHISSEHWDGNGERVNTEETLSATSPKWDGGFVICGINTEGELWAVRDSHGIRPAFWYADEEKIIVASEKSAIIIAAGVNPSEIHRLNPGVMLKVDKGGKLSFKRVIEEKPIAECVFERIYFSRSDNAEIMLEREKLGYLLAQHVDNITSDDICKTYLSFVPASARSAFMGMVAYFAGMKLPVFPQQLAGNSADKYMPHKLVAADGNIINFGRTIEKSKALRTFISTETGREELVEKTYKKVLPELPEGIDRIVIVDDSIVRGTTLKSSVISLLDTYGVDKIIVVSCAPQVRYPDFYGIDMSRLGELIAFRAAVNIIKRKGLEHILKEVYDDCKSALEGKQRTQNFVKRIYEQTAGKEISKEVTRMVTPENCHAKVRVVYLWTEDLREAIPDHTGDWCFTGNYPTSGAYTKICQAYVNYYEGNIWQR